MMELPFGPWTSAHRQHHLPKWKQKPNPSKSIVAGKSESTLTLLFGFHISCFWMFLLTEYVNPGCGFMLKNSPWDRLGVTLGSWTPSVVTRQLTKTFYWLKHNYPSSLFWCISYNSFSERFYWPHKVKIISLKPGLLMARAILVNIYQNQGILSALVI